MILKKCFPTKFYNIRLSGTQVIAKNEKNNFNIDTLYIFPHQQLDIFVQIFCPCSLMVYRVYLKYANLSSGFIYNEKVFQY